MDKYTNLTNLLTKLETWKQGMISVFGTDDDYVRGIATCCSVVEKAPITDAEEVIHSHWIKDAFCTTGDPYYTCANCGRFVRILYPNCPWCRAKMDADRTIEVDNAISEIKMLEELLNEE